METGKLSQVGPQIFLSHENRNKRMERRTQHLLHPDDSPATIDQGMADLLKQTFQGFFRTDKTLSSHAQRYAWQTPTSRNQTSKEPSKPSTSMGEPALMGSFPKPLKP